MNKILLIFIGLFLFSTNVQADGISNISASPTDLTDLAPGTTVTLSFRVEVTMPFGGTSNGCTIWDGGGISITSSTRVNTGSLSFTPNADGCPGAITSTDGGTGCPNDANTAVDGTLTFQLDGSADTGPWNITFDIGYYLSASDCNIISYSMSGSVLPVELTSFEAKEAKEGVQLNWTTASEINNSYFTVERSTDGKNFTAIGEVTGAGDSYESIDYQFMDTRVAELDSEIAYYRLMQTDFDGRTNYSEVVNLSLKDHQNTTITNLFLEGEMTKIQVNSNSDQTAKIGIFDVSGKLVKTQSVFLHEGQNNLDIQHEIERGGIYFYSLTCSSGIVTKKFFH